MVLASSSSAATIPVSISSTMASGHVSETIARFVIPLGATVRIRLLSWISVLCCSFFVCLSN
jgi:Na+/H+-dicarboxylate symporter